MMQVHVFWQNGVAPLLWLSLIFRAKSDDLENVILGGRLRKGVDQNQVFPIVELSTEDDGEPLLWSRRTWIFLLYRVHDFIVHRSN